MEFDGDRTQEWLIVSNSTGILRASYQGTGVMEIEDESSGNDDEFKVYNLGFFVSVIDGSYPHGSGGDDFIRILIWDLQSLEVIFDNQRNPDDGTSPARIADPTSPARHDDDDDDDGNIKVILQNQSTTNHDTGDDDYDGSDIIDDIMYDTIPEPLDPEFVTEVDLVITYIHGSFDPEFVDEYLLEGKGLLKKLDRAKTNHLNGNDEGACKKINKVVNQTEKLLLKGKIPKITGEPLLMKVNDLKPFVCTP